MDKGYVLVIGAAGLDIKGLPEMQLQDAADNPGIVRTNFGGVGRNIAENLVRLEIPTHLLTVVGDDTYGDLLMAQAAAAGVDVTEVLQVSDGRTGSHIAIMNSEGDLAMAVSDYDIIKHMDAAFLETKRETFARARMIVIDLNLSAEALEKIIALAGEYNVPVCVDPTSPAHAVKICSYLNALYVITPNAREVSSLCDVKFKGQSIEDALNAARHLVSLGTEIAIVTLSNAGVVYASSTLSGHIPAPRIRIIDSTGAGDALAAAVIYGILNEIRLEESMRLGITSATLTLRSEEAVLPELSPDLLYEHLIV